MQHRHVGTIYNIHLFSQFLIHKNKEEAHSSEVYFYVKKGLALQSILNFLYVKIRQAITNSPTGYVNATLLLTYWPLDSVGLEIQGTTASTRQYGVRVGRANWHSKAARGSTSGYLTI